MSLKIITNMVVGRYKNKELKQKVKISKLYSHHEAISQCRRDNSSDNSRHK